MQNTVLIYRIEDQDLKGPYCQSNALSMTVDSQRHPTPSKDSSLVYDFATHFNPDGYTDFYVPDHYRFGFSSMSQLRSWIYDDDWMIDLHDNGYHLSIYELERSAVAIGYSQAMCNKDKAILLRTQSILKAFNITLKDNSK